MVRDGEERGGEWRRGCCVVRWGKGRGDCFGEAGGRWGDALIETCYSR